MDTRNTATLTTQNTGHGETALGGLNMGACSLRGGEGMVVWLSRWVMARLRLLGAIDLSELSVWGDRRYDMARIGSG